MNLETKGILRRQIVNRRAGATPVAGRVIWRVDGSCGAAHICIMAHRIALVSFHSSSVAAGGYDGGKHVLRLRYIDGDIYDYLDVPSRVFQALLNAPSKGRFVNRHVKPHFAYRRVGENGSRRPVPRRLRRYR